MLIIATIADLALGLKVSKFQNEIMKLSFLPKYEAKVVRIFALSFFLFVSASCLLGSLTCLRMITAKKTESKIGKWVSLAPIMHFFLCQYSFCSVMWSSYVCYLFSNLCRFQTFCQITEARCIKTCVTMHVCMSFLLIIENLTLFCSSVPIVVWPHF